MKRVAPGYCIAAILVVASSFGQSPPTAPRSISNSIEVFVTTSAGASLADADVFITHKPGPTSNSSIAAPVTLNARTGSDGRAIFRNLPGGVFDVRVERQGYMPVRSDGGTASGFTVSVQVGSPTQSTTRQIKVPLIGGGIISGKVEGSSGRPAAGVAVTALQMRYQNGQKLLSDAVAISGTAAVRTDDRGEFRIFWLAPGDYYIRVESPEPRSLHSYAADLFYPGVTNFSSATRVAVREGQETGGLRIVRTPSNGVTVSGTVNNTIKDAEPYQIILTAEGPLHKSQWIGLSGDPNANDSEFPFEISDVPAGNYELHTLVRVNEPDNRKSYTAKTKLTVGSQNLRNIQMTVRKGGDLQVSVFVPTEVQSYLRNLPRRPDEEQPLRVALQPEESSQAIPSVQFQSSEFENNTITISESNVVPGRYRLARINPLPPDVYVGDLRQNGKTVYDGVVDVGETPTEVQVYIECNGGTVQGSVMAPSLETQNYLAVVLVPDAPRRGNFLLYKRQDVGSTPTDPGQFRFSFVGVAPGNYKVIAVDTLPRGSEMDPDVFARYESRAIAVSVTPGATRDIQVPLIRTR